MYRNDLKYTFQILGYEGENVTLDIYSGGLAIEPLRHSYYKLTYGNEIELLIRKLERNFHRASL